METMELELGIERVWSDSDALSQTGYETVVATGPAAVLSETVRLEATFERLWSDDDALQTGSDHPLKLAA
jgi:hypothetical protein